MEYLLLNTNSTTQKSLKQSQRAIFHRQLGDNVMQEGNMEFSDLYFTVLKK